MFASPKKRHFESIIKIKGYTYVGLQLNDPTGKRVEEELNETCFCFETGKDKTLSHPTQPKLKSTNFGTLKEFW